MQHLKRTVLLVAKGYQYLMGVWSVLSFISISLGLILAIATLLITRTANIILIEIGFAMLIFGIPLGMVWRLMYYIIEKNETPQVVSKYLSVATGHLTAKKSEFSIEDDSDSLSELLNAARR